MTDQEIIHQLTTQNEEALRFLVNKWQHKVFNTCIGLLQNHEDAEEITQDVFIEVFRSAHAFDFRSSLSTWIYRVAVNKSLDKIRYDKRKKRAGILARLFDKTSKTSITDIPDFIHPGVQLERQELATILFKAIDLLPANQKTAYVLHHVEGLPYSEIAQVMETTVSAVESLLVRGRDNLRKSLGKYYTENFK